MIKSRIDDGIIEIIHVDQMFSYRFFTFVHDPKVQSVIFEYQDYIKIIDLYKEWHEYRNRKGQPIPNEECNLIVAISDLSERKRVLNSPMPH